MMPLRDTGPAIDLGTLLAGIVKPAEPSLSVSGLSMDSRCIEPGWLFLACQGGREHGMAHAAQAIGRGAVAILAEATPAWSTDAIAKAAAELGVPILSVPELRRHASELAGRCFGHPGRAMRVIGVTGTNGKTSVTHFLAQALGTVSGTDSGVGTRTAVIGTLGNGPLDALATATHTTPDAVDLQAALARLRDRAGTDVVAIEVSSHGLDQHRVAAIPFHTAVFTNLSRDHLDYHGTLQAYGAAKARLFRHPGLELAVINTDQEFGQSLADDVGVPVIRVGRDDRCRCVDGAFVQLHQVSTDQAGLEFDFASGWGDGRVRVPVFGAFNADNLLPVLALLLQAGATPVQCAERLAALRPVPGRMEAVPTTSPSAPLVMVDYAHTPDALEQALSSLRAHGDGQLICVFGCGGDRDAGKRPLMGRIAERLADRVVITDDNPRSEDGAGIVRDIVAGMQDPQACRIERQRAAAIRLAVAGTGPDDLVLIAGKGHEDYQLVGDLRLPFSDRAEASAALAEFDS